MRMNDEQPNDRGTLRERFPWLGLVSIDEPDLSSRYREMMAEARYGREAIEAVEYIRHSA